MKLLSVVLDIDECANAVPPDCDVNAVCTNTQGSYACTCKEGFYKDGQNCTSNYIFFFCMAFQEIIFSTT